MCLFVLVLARQEKERVRRRKEDVRRSIGGIVAQPPTETRAPNVRTSVLLSRELFTLLLSALYSPGASKKRDILEEVKNGSELFSSQVLGKGKGKGRKAKQQPGNNRAWI
jgi:hypothetical protein